MIEQDAKILTNIQKTLTADPNVTQRTLAQNSNISLGTIFLTKITLCAIAGVAVERTSIAPLKNISVESIFKTIS